jgi:hypothetical protein
MDRKKMRRNSLKCPSMITSVVTATIVLRNWFSEEMKLCAQVVGVLWKR